MNGVYDFIEAWSKDGEFAGWFDISIKPPNIIHILINIKDWGCAIGHLTHDEQAFICSLPCECVDIPKDYAVVPIDKVTLWAVIPKIKGNFPWV